MNTVSGLVFSDGPHWNKRRRTVLKYLKHYGYGSKAMEGQISEECQALTKLLANSAGRAVCVNKLFNVCIVNVVWRLVAGKRLVKPIFNKKSNLKNILTLCCSIKKYMKHNLITVKISHGSALYAC